MRKKVLITGGAGFVGSHLADELLECGYEVRALDKPLSGLGQNHSARHAHEERDADLLFELLDLHAERGLRVVYSVRGGGERARLGNRQKRLQLTNLHRSLRYQG